MDRTLKCFNCQADNPRGNNFCGKCGTELKPLSATEQQILDLIDEWLPYTAIRRIYIGLFGSKPARKVIKELGLSNYKEKISNEAHKYFDAKKVRDPKVIRWYINLYVEWRKAYIHDVTRGKGREEISEPIRTALKGILFPGHALTKYVGRIPGLEHYRNIYDDSEDWFQRTGKRFSALVPRRIARFLGPGGSEIDFRYDDEVVVPAAEAIVDYFNDQLKNL